MPHFFLKWQCCAICGGGKLYKILSARKAKDFIVNKKTLLFNFLL